MRPRARVARPAPKSIRIVATAQPEQGSGSEREVHRGRQPRSPRDDARDHSGDHDSKDLVVKLPAERVDGLIASGPGRGGAVRRADLEVPARGTSVRGGPPE